MLWFCFVFSLFRIATSSGDGFQSLLHWTTPLHEACKLQFDLRAYDPIYRGLLCGDANLPRETADVFKRTGLYHLLIVSGSHFVFLEQALNLALKRHIKTKFCVFLVFAAICQFQPPVTRALLSIILQTLSRRWHFYWRPEYVALLSGLSCLILFPEWILSHSLILSWLASLALTFARKSHTQHFLIFVFIFPVFYNSSLWGVLNNILVSALFGGFYFPFTAITALLPHGASIGNPIWNATQDLMQKLPGETPTGALPATSIPLFLFWLYIFSLQILRRFLRLSTERAQ